MPVAFECKSVVNFAKIGFKYAIESGQPCRCLRCAFYNPVDISLECRIKLIVVVIPQTIVQTRIDLVRNNPGLFADCIKS
jgi:hypothetical protein